MEPNTQAVTPEQVAPAPHGESLDEYLARQPVADKAVELTGEAAMAQALVAAGKLTQAQADAMIASDLADAGQAVTSNAHAAADPMWNELPAALSAPANAADYRLPNNTALPPSFDEMQLASEAFRAANMPVGIAQSIFQRISQVAAQRLTPDQIELMARETDAKFQAQYGDRAPAMMAKASRLLGHVAKSHPGILDALVRSGAEWDYSIVRQVAEHADRLLK
ncbi:hypothetical protein [Paraburkholderia domus]|uniref:hypothetical protein n=1 Tax=Paraburkholderia domus TaxID=2793075 RepID=UPI001B2B6D8C|nr:hypothetical protein [Paraburkholderia domus]CAE6835113.1 hypothetical protein R75483_06881 [Paraburkholderia domus]